MKINSNDLFRIFIGYLRVEPNPKPNPKTMNEKSSSNPNPREPKPTDIRHETVPPNPREPKPADIRHETVPLPSLVRGLSNRQQRHSHGVCPIGSNAIPSVLEPAARSRPSSTAGLSLRGERLPQMPLKKIDSC